ncbi:MAG: DNA mismatch repair protein MutS [Chloroherpetonaceae bacterium]|nr:DNA mismatch repair protein MutS [Chloroherpetonaceae bacterium]
MRQYEKIKSRYPDVILLFRVGDFYETFHDDAKRLSEAVGIVLTKRANGAAADVPLAGFPHHALETYVAKLVRQGFRVAVCEQMEDPKFARGIVKREVTDIITPGVNFSDKLLDEKRNNYLCAVHFAAKGSIGIAFIDVTTAEFQALEVERGAFAEALQTIQPSEILYSKKQKAERLFLEQSAPAQVAFTELDEWLFSLDYAEQTLRNHFKVHSLKGFGIESLDAAKVAASVILNYLADTQRHKLEYIRKLSRLDLGDTMTLDPQTKRNLEILYSMQDGSRSGTLLGILDKTLTAMGARMLKKWLARPSRNLSLIHQRLDAVAELVADSHRRTALRDLLRGLCDLERVLSRIAIGRAAPRDLLILAGSLAQIPNVQHYLSACQSRLLQQLCAALYDCSELVSEIQAAISPDAPASPADGNVIQAGYHAELDELREIVRNAEKRLIQIQQEEREKTGIASLKVLYNKVFGYYIEISHANRSKVPPHYERKQTLVNAERYTIPALKEYEAKILSAEEKRLELETRLFSELCQKVASAAERIQANAEALAILDTLQSFAECATLYGYSKPEVTDEDILQIVQGRHPVLERLMPPGEKYVPNDCLLDSETRLMLITGPNMAGKSSYLRQTGLIVLLAQIGSFVPAERARIGLVDKIFTRVGASDNLAAGESTFLVEMNEAAHILNHATARSLILLDEIGRGTSTYDGMSIAWAITEHIHDVIGAKTLFATHYHELSELEAHLPRLKNFNAAVVETGDRVIFLRKIERGAAQNSFGIEVAKMAGLPASVIERAREILARLEREEAQRLAEEKDLRSKAKKVELRAIPQENFQISLFEMGDSKLREALLQLDLNRLTPIEALLKLAELRRLAEGK